MTDTSAPPPPKFPEERIDAIATPLHRFVHAEASGGVVLLLAAIAALILANSALGPSFESIWTTTVGLIVGEATWEHSLRHWINDGLVTLFFFVVGLEIKREIVSGELSAPRAAALPIAGAVGGMVVPAAIYLAIASGPQAASGWGVVMATDIAFVVGCLALLGRRIPDSLRIFVLALAIIDDIGAILVIAVGYGHEFHAIPFAAALLGLVVTAIMQWLGVRQMPAYWAVGLLTWAAMHESGIHPTITGVALGLLTPATPWIEASRLNRFLEWAGRNKPAGPDQDLTHRPKSVRKELARAAIESISPQQRLEDQLHPWSAFVILPLFALANAGVAISGASAFDSITVAIVAGLVLGKPLGIFIFSYLVVIIGLAHKPQDISWPMMLGAGALCGIGFTMSLFIGNLAFEGAALQSAKLGILVASLISAVVGMSILLLLSKKRADTGGV